jgi:hypothetical protein
MTDAKAFAVLRADIRKLFPRGAVRDRWLQWADRIQREEVHGAAWAVADLRAQDPPHACQGLPHRYTDAQRPIRAEIVASSSHGVIGEGL